PPPANWAPSRKSSVRHRGFGVPCQPETASAKPVHAICGGCPWGGWQCSVASCQFTLGRLLTPFRLGRFGRLFRATPRPVTPVTPSPFTLVIPSGARNLLFADCCS